MLRSLKKICLILLVSFCLLVPFLSLAQDMDTPVVDGFTGETTYSTTLWVIGQNQHEYLMAYFTRTKNDYHLKFRVDMLVDDHTYFTITKGDNVNIKLSNNDILTLKAANNTEAEKKLVRHGYYTLTYWSAYVDCALSDTDLDKLNSGTFTGVRIQSDNGNFDFGINTKEAYALIKMQAMITGNKVNW